MGLFSRKTSDKTKWVCKACTQGVSIKDIGALIKGGKITIPTDGNCENIVAKEDEVVCSKCSLQITSRQIINKASEEKRSLTISELRSLEEQLRSDNLNEAYLKIKNRENLPDNSARYDEIAFDNEGKLFVDFACPKCLGKTNALLQGISIKTPEQQLEYYMRMHEKVPMTCPNCKHNFTLWK